MKKILLSAAVAMMVATGCRKEKEIKMTPVNNGTLKVKITDKANAVISNLAVRIYLTNDPTNIIDEQITNTTGDVTFNNVLEGTYTIYIKEVLISRKKYTVTQQVQITSGNTKSMTIKPDEYVGTLIMTFKSNNAGRDTVVPNTMVAVFRNYDYVDIAYPDYNSIKAICFDSAKTDANGKFSMTVPSDVEINFMMYNSPTKAVTSTTNRLVGKGDEMKYIITVNWNFLF